MEALNAARVGEVGVVVGRGEGVACGRCVPVVGVYVHVEACVGCRSVGVGGGIVGALAGVAGDVGGFGLLYRLRRGFAGLVGVVVYVVLIVLRGDGECQRGHADEQRE